MGYYIDNDDSLAACVADGVGNDGAGVIDSCDGADDDVVEYINQREIIAVVEMN